MVSLFMIITIAFEIWIHIISDKTLDEVRVNKIFDTFWYTIVTILYIFVIYYLIKQLNKINENELEHEKMSIIRQFAMFFAGYLAWTVYIIIECFNPTDEAMFVDAVSHSIAVILWDVVPITYMLFVHHRTFRSMISQLKLSTVENGGGAGIHFSSNVDKLQIQAIVRESN